MSTVHGKNGTVTYGGSQANVVNWTLDITAEPVENTVMGGTYKSRILGLKDWTATVDVLVDSTTGPAIGDTAALTEMAAYGDSGSSVDLVLSNGSYKFTGKAYAKEITMGVPVGDMVTLSIVFDGDGALSESAES